MSVLIHLHFSFQYFLNYFNHWPNTQQHVYRALPVSSCLRLKKAQQSNGLCLKFWYLVHHGCVWINVGFLTRYCMKSLLLSITELPGTLSHAALPPAPPPAGTCPSSGQRPSFQRNDPDASVGWRKSWYLLPYSSGSHWQILTLQKSQSIFFLVAVACSRLH